MPINVICPGCKKRFKVSDKWAGQKGPCPKCKAEITIPAKDDEVVVHAPVEAGPTDSKGRSVIQPILYEESKFSTKMAIGIAAAFLVAIVAAALLRSYDGAVPFWIRAMGALLLAPPLILGGYAVLRDSELEPYRGKELWTRIAICSVVYMAIWGAYFWVWWVLDLEEMVIWQYGLVAVIAFGTGGFTASACFDLDFMVGAVHYGFYLIVTVTLSYLAKIAPF